jgi:putative ABC transport system permease protein
VPLRLWARLLSLEALAALARNKVRTSLAILAIAVGIATVIWVSAIGRAGKEQALAQLDALGDNLIWIEAGSRSVNGLRSGSHGENTLTARDAAAIRDECPQIARCSENVDGSLQVVAGDHNWNTRFRGVSPDYAEVKKWRIAAGAYFTADQTEHSESVVVIGATVAHQLFGDAPAVGQAIRAGNNWFEIVGVLAPKGPSATGQDQDDTVMMPWTTAQRRIVGKDVTWLDDILCSAATTDAIPAATAEVVSLLRERHHIDGDDDFNIRHPEELLQAKLKSSKTLERLLLVIASISLMVGGIGIMNVMLASVAQRTREIGVRMAIGARPAAIRLQFFGEAIMLGLIGGALGVLASLAGSSLLESYLGWPLASAPRTSAEAVAFSIAVGVVFGYYPARRAANLDPIDALRSE